jgi:hypothetical protein
MPRAPFLIRAGKEYDEFIPALAAGMVDLAVFFRITCPTSLRRRLPAGLLPPEVSSTFSLLTVRKEKIELYRSVAIEAQFRLRRGRDRCEPSRLSRNLSSPLEKPSQETVENFRIPDNSIMKSNVMVCINTTGDQR